MQFINHFNCCFKKSVIGLVVSMLTLFGFNLNSSKAKGLNKSFPADSLLFPSFYNPILGNYISAGGDTLIVSRSQKQLFIYNQNGNTFRGLNKVSALVWTSGDRVISTKPILKYSFKGDSLNVYEGNRLIFTALKKALYKTEEIAFSNSSGLKLAGTLFLPQKANGKAIVLVHGSGAQDRNGTASGMRLLADVLVRKGITVLTYDKQGVGSSEGNWAKLNFGMLAADALSGVDYLKTRNDLHLNKIGMGGYSQAGWVMARAVQQRPDLAFVLGISAAGNGITVAAQNTYDVETQMKCSGTFTKLQIKQINTQQGYFFDYLLNRRNGDVLDRYTTKIKTDTALKDWLYPTTAETNFNDQTQWYNALEVGFDPLPAWKNYKGAMLAVLGEFDDSTPSKIVLKNLQALNNKQIQIRIIPGSQHLGLQTQSVCNAKMNNLTNFAAQFYPTIIDWINKL